jgi:hypothetical protein
MLALERVLQQGELIPAVGGVEDDWDSAIRVAGEAEEEGEKPERQ